MSCDFGPIPLPTSPIQTYWEERYFSRSSTANPKPAGDDIAPQLVHALERLAEEQRQDGGDDTAESESRPPVVVQKKVPHRRAQSIGQRLLSGGIEFLSTIARDQGAVQKMKQS